MRNLLSRASVLVATLLISACRDPLPTVPHQRPPSEASQLRAYELIGSATIPVPIAASAQGVVVSWGPTRDPTLHRFRTGLKVPTGYHRITVTVTGSIQGTLASNAEYLYKCWDRPYKIRASAAGWVEPYGDGRNERIMIVGAEIIGNDGRARRMTLFESPDDLSVSGTYRMRISSPSEVTLYRAAGFQGYHTGCYEWTSDDMQASIRIEREYEIPDPVDPDTKLAVTCTPNPVTRGEQVTCTASKEPATATGELKITGWSFEGRARTDGGVTSTEWKGVMVTGGTVEVRGAIGTSPVQTDTAGVDVAARTDWAGKMIYPTPLPTPQVDTAGEQNFPHSPVTVDVDGRDHWVDGALGKYTFGIKWRGYFSQVQSGPNNGWWYLKSPPPFHTPEVWLSTFLQPRDPFYEAQTGKSAGGRNPPRGYNGWCNKADMEKLRQEVLDHEGAISGPRLSHHEFNVDYFSKHDPGPEVEDVVFYLTDQNQSFSQVADSELGRALLDRVRAANDASVHATTNLYTVPCKVQLP